MATACKEGDRVPVGSFERRENPSVYLGFTRWSGVELWEQDVKQGTGATDLAASLGSSGIRYYFGGVIEKEKGVCHLRCTSLGFRIFDQFDFTGFQVVAGFTPDQRELGRAIAEQEGLKGLSALFRTTLLTNGDFRAFAATKDRLNEVGVGRGMPELVCSDFVVISPMHKVAAPKPEIVLTLPVP
jgi:hypothetical protein